jgi:hypothetical protein
MNLVIAELYDPHGAKLIQLASSAPLASLNTNLHDYLLALD